MADDIDRDEEETNEPWYDAEDIGCDCTENNIESEWERSSEDGVYYCTGCGENPIE